ncbi:UNVERIFIED_CONTAM: hypothetical protein RMT77_008563 [Armadillidium vulgare]
MGVNVFWPPLAVLSMGVMVIIFIILKYGDKLFRARTAPKQQNYEMENLSSENATFNGDERSIEEFEDYFEEEQVDEENPPSEIIPIREKYEYAV